ncbi:hypothetical protein [Desulfobacca acetoxidans]|uniref:PEP motif anchor domain protein n=1 Tax=Desulfobacca acetoxidans (strain ATCC 700848 / DSM 11109 / ASRB2) TaxID=880072 RepID=F2NFA2_DESAR|nr:hypothetical protein [Desulfobacca acetoxidans]AEB08657.1 hypothetical protein Desac_0778 [Desulfobacca acetoxidans DSM 11109]
MKPLRFLLLSMLISLFTLTPALASYWSLTPDGQIDTEIGDEIAFTLTFHSTENIPLMISWQLDFQVDATELEPATLASGKYKVYYNTFDAGFGPLNIKNGYFKDGIYDLSAGSLFDVLNITAGNSYDFATFYMKVIADNTWDGIPDVALLSQIGIEWLGIQEETGIIHHYAGDDGASVGSPPAVPIPGAIWLLGMGLLRLAAGARKRERL